MPLPGNPQLLFMSSDEEKAYAASIAKLDAEHGMTDYNVMRIKIGNEDNATPECFRLEEWESVNFGYLTTLSCLEKEKEKWDVHERVARLLGVHPLQMVVTEDDDGGLRLHDSLLADGYQGVWLYNATLRGE